MEWGTVGRGSKRASLVRPRHGAGRQLLLLANEDVAAITDHMDQADDEFVAKMIIACAFLSCLLAWLAWSSWWDKSRRKRAGRGRGRGRRVQPRPPLRRTNSLDSLPDSASSPIQGVGAADGCHRGALAVDRSKPQQQQDKGRNQGQRQDGRNEFYNPLWGQRGASRCSGESWPMAQRPTYSSVDLRTLATL